MNHRALYTCWKKHTSVTHGTSFTMKRQLATFIAAGIKGDVVYQPLSRIYEFSGEFPGSISSRGDAREYSHTRDSIASYNLSRGSMNLRERLYTYTVYIRRKRRFLDPPQRDKVPPGS